jgi:hypothetical protein
LLLRSQTREAKPWIRVKLRKEQQEKNDAHFASWRSGGWLTLSRRLRKKGLNLLLNIGGIAAWALDALLIVIADGHCEREILATFLTKIFVKRHRGSALWSFFDVAKPL